MFLFNPFHIFSPRQPVTAFYLKHWNTSRSVFLCSTFESSSSCFEAEEDEDFDFEDEYLDEEEVRDLLISS